MEMIYKIQIQNIHLSNYYTDEEGNGYVFQDKYNTMQGSGAGTSTDFGGGAGYADGAGSMYGTG